MLKPAIEPNATFELVGPSALADRWDQYVLDHEKGTVFHTTGMHEVFSKTVKNSPWAMAAVNADGKIVALGCAVRIETLGGLASRVASRSIWYSQPICDDSDEGVAGLEAVIAAHDQAMKSKVLFTEIRPIFEKGGEYDALCSHDYEFKDYLNYVVDLTPESNPETRLSKSCRKQVRKCAKRGVTIETVTSHDSIDQMYKLVQFSYDRSDVPLVDAEIFHHALDILGDDVVEVRLAKLDGKVVASGITLKFKRIVYAWYGGSYRVAGLAPFAALTWDEIESGSREGFGFYDFGGAGWPDEDYGPRDFKAKFGGELVRYGRYRKIDSALKLHAATGAFKVVKRIKSLVKSFGTEQTEEDNQS